MIVSDEPRLFHTNPFEEDTWDSEYALSSAEGCVVLPTARGSTTIPFRIDTPFWEPTLWIRRTGREGEAVGTEADFLLFLLGAEGEVARLEWKGHGRGLRGVRGGERHRAPLNGSYSTAAR